MDERENAVNSKKVLLVDNTIFQDSCQVERVCL